MSKVILDQDKCIGCGACVAIDPENFDFEDRLSKVINDTATPTAKDAEEACPTGAITILDNDESKNEHTCTCDHCECDHEDESCQCHEKEAA